MGHGLDAACHTLATFLHQASEGLDPTGTRGENLITQSVALRHDLPRPYHAPLLVHTQRGLCVMVYSCLHETSNICPGFVEKGARTARSRAALQRCLRDAPLPDPACQRPRKLSSED